MRPYGVRHPERKCRHGFLVKGWLNYVTSHSQAYRRANKKHARRLVF